MKKIGYTMLLTATVVSASALAQDAVTLYGAIDTGVEYFTNAAPTGGSVARIPVIGGGDLPSRIGVRGSEDLGGGLKGIFTLEDGFSASNGAMQQNSRLFGRQAFVGLKGDWGQLSFGRQYSMTNWGLADSNVLGPTGFGGLASFDPYLLAARVDNSVLYLGTFSGFTVGANYSFGRDTQSAGNCAGETAADSRACRALSAMLKYDGNSWGVAATYDRQRGGAGAAPITVVPGLPGVAFQKSGDTDTRNHLNGYFMLGSVRVGGGLLQRTVTGDVKRVKSYLSYLGASVPFGPWALDTQILHIKNSDYDANGTLGTVRLNYNFSKRTALYGMVSEMRNSGKGGVYSVSASTAVPAVPAPGKSQTGVMVGVRHYF